MPQLIAVKTEVVAISVMALTSVLIIGFVIITGSGFRWTSIMTATCAGVFFASIAAYMFIRHGDARGQQIGIAIVPGVIFLVASGLIQAAVDLNSFRSNVDFTSDLSGFDPKGRSLAGMNFSKKNMSVAYLQGADLRGVRLREAILTDANLADANLRDADLFYATLWRTDLNGADFTGADLRGAEIATQWMKSIDNAVLTNARVTDETCWKIPTRTGKPKPPDVPPLPRITPTDTGWLMLEKLGAANLVPLQPGRALGHVCTKIESGTDRATKFAEYIFVCPDLPYLRTSKMMSRAPKGSGDSNLYCTAP